MDAKKQFHQLLKRDFFPLVRVDGFKGSGNTFLRTKGDRIDVIGIQGSQAGGQCCVNLGVHFSFLPLEGGGRNTDTKKLKAFHCTFRDRMHETSESDHWWLYGANDEEAELSVANLIDLYQRRCHLFFARYEPFPDVFERVAPAALDAGDFSSFPGTMTQVTASLTMARIMHHLGRSERCREFAMVGLRHLGRAVGLQAELERLQDAG